LRADRLPVLFAMRGGYVGLCLKFKRRRPAQVVLVEEPLFEDETGVAESYDDLLATFFSRVGKQPAMRLLL
jgi:hypothetical protein